MTTDVTIELALVDDIDTLAKFNQNIALETEGIELIADVIHAGVSQIIENPSLGFYLVAKTQQQVIGSLMVTTEWSDWRNGQFWWIQSVYVHRDYRRQGIYRKLYQQVKQLAEKKHNVCGFRLYVENKNHIARQTYEQLGMKLSHYRMYEELMTGVEFIKPDNSNLSIGDYK